VWAIALGWCFPSLLASRLEKVTAESLNYRERTREFDFSDFVREKFSRVFHVAQQLD
jgi:hypothetical protein